MSAPLSKDARESTQADLYACKTAAEQFLLRRITRLIEYAIADINKMIVNSEFGPFAPNTIVGAYLDFSGDGLVVVDSSTRKCTFEFTDDTFHFTFDAKKFLISDDGDTPMWKEIQQFAEKYECRLNIEISNVQGHVVRKINMTLCNTLNVHPEHKYTASLIGYALNRKTRAYTMKRDDDECDDIELSLVN